MKTIQQGGFTIEFPETFSELTQTQLYDLAECISSARKKIDAHVLLAYKWGKKIFEFNEQQIKEVIKELKVAQKATEIEELTDDLNSLQYNRMHLSGLCEWINDEHVSKKWLIPKLTITQRKNGKRSFAGPEHLFANIQFWEWCRAEQFFSAYMKGFQRIDFKRFVACLYHPITNGVRDPFDDGKWNEYMNWFDAITPVQEQAIVLNYLAIKCWLALQHPHVFKRRTEGDADGENTKDTNMMELLLRAAKEQHLDEEVVAKKLLLTELAKMEITGKDAAQLKKETEAQK